MVEGVRLIFPVLRRVRPLTARRGAAPSGNPPSTPKLRNNRQRAALLPEAKNGRLEEAKPLSVSR